MPLTMMPLCLAAFAAGVIAAPPSPRFVSFAYGDSGCLASPLTFPCAGGATDSCPVFLAPCASPTANWSADVEPGSLVSGFECGDGGCGLNVDCDGVAPRTVVKLAAGIPRAAVAFNATAGTLVYTSRAGVVRCLTGGLAGAPTPPCFAGEAFDPKQITIDDCAAPATRGWRLVPPAATAEAAA